MARYYRRRYTRVVKPKKKWATNIRKILMDTGATALNTSKVGYSVVLCANSAESTQGGAGTATVPTPTVIKTGNFKVQCDSHIVTSSSSVIHVLMYIMYIPEGVFTESAAGSAGARVSADYDSLSNIVQRHPEWILAWRQFSSDLVAATANLDRITFSSRLKRNLNSGDEICAVILASEDLNQQPGGVISRLVVNGMAQFWTCNN